MLNLDPGKIYKASFRRGITWNPLTWLGFAIRIIARVIYNHVAVVFNLDGKWYLQEAIGDGVVTIEIQESNAVHYYTHYSISLPKKEVNYNKAIEKIKSLEGKKYDFEGLLFYQLWLNLFNKWIGRAIKGKDKYYCYEHVAEVFEIENAYRVLPREMNKMFDTISEGEISCLQ